jgi:cysteine desulfurase family protein (TIGR01976 family)
VLRVRSAFPALASGFVYLDNAGGSQTLGTVADRIRDYLLTTNVQLGASYEVSVHAGERVRAAVNATARYVNALPGEIVFGSSTTQLLANLALAMEPSLVPGDELVITEADHEANASPWRRLAARAGLVLKTWPLDKETLLLEPAALEPLLSPRTRLVCFPHVSNLIGSIHDVRAITQLVHAHGARVCVDGVAFAPHRAIDVAAWDVDYYVFSLYKVYGPHAAVLYGKHAHLEALAGINHDFIGSVPYKLQPGNLNFELAYGTTAIYEYLASIGSLDAVAAHEAALAERLLGFLRGRVRILGEASSDAARRVPTISFVTADPEAVVRCVDAHGIGIRHGDFYAKGVVRALGLPDGVVRISAVHYNTLDEIDRTIAALATAGL